MHLFIIMFLLEFLRDPQSIDKYMLSSSKASLKHSPRNTTLESFLSNLNLTSSDYAQIQQLQQHIMYPSLNNPYNYLQPNMSHPIEKFPLIEPRNYQPPIQYRYNYQAMKASAVLRRTLMRAKAASLQADKNVKLPIFGKHVNPMMISKRTEKMILQSKVCFYVVNIIYV